MLGLKLNLVSKRGHRTRFKNMNITDTTHQERLGTVWRQTLPISTNVIGQNPQNNALDFVGLMQKRRNSIANAQNLCPFCIKPSTRLSCVLLRFGNDQHCPFAVTLTDEAT